MEEIERTRRGKFRRRKLGWKLVCLCVFSAAGTRAKRVWSILNEASMHLSDTDQEIKHCPRHWEKHSSVFTGPLVGKLCCCVHICRDFKIFLQQPDDNPNRD